MVSIPGKAGALESAPQVQLIQAQSSRTTRAVNGKIRGFRRTRTSSIGKCHMNCAMRRIGSCEAVRRHGPEFEDENLRMPKVPQGGEGHLRAGRLGASVASASG